MRSFHIAWLALAGLTLHTPAFAQELEAGLHVVVNAATFSGESEADFSYRGGFGAGLSLGVRVTENFLVQPEVRYIVKGGKTEDAVIEGISSPLRATFAIAYIEVPVLLVYRIDSGRSVRPRFFAGPYAARRLDATIEWRLASGGPAQSDSDDSVVKNDFGLMVGAGVELDVRGEAVLVGARAALGLSDVRDRPDAPLNNLGFEIFAGLLLR